MTVLGIGYVSLVIGYGFSETGNKELFIDIDEAKVEKMQPGVTRIYEPNWDVVFKEIWKQIDFNFRRLYSRV